MTTSHPYYPQSLVLAHYVPNSRPTGLLLLTAAALVGGLVLLAWIATRTNRQMSWNDRFRFVWFVLCGALHCGFEAYWLFHHREIAGRSDLLSELWKEYAHSDSRYLIADPLLLMLEMMTVCLWGPLCIMTSVALWRRSPLSCLYQHMASMGHLFSCVLYFVIDLPSGFQYCNPHPRYFWLYFVTFNAPWLVVPGLLVYQSTSKIVAALQIQRSTGAPKRHKD